LEIRCIIRERVFGLIVCEPLSNLGERGPDKSGPKSIYLK